MSGVARAAGLDDTLALLREGYEFIPSRCRRLESDAFETRLLGSKTVCLSGAEGARLFYDPTRMQRRGAMPMPIRKTLIGRGGVQGLDGAAHRHRKHLFMSLMAPERIAALADASAREWRRAAERWEGRERVVLFPEAQQVLCRCVCEWAGVPLPEPEVARRTSEFDAMIGGGPKTGWRHLQSRRARRSAERWIARLVERVRSGDLRCGDEAALAAIAAHRDLDGELLPARVAAIEVLNVLRPTVAVATYVVFAALAMQRNPAAASALATDDAALEPFVHEVRRFYPFFPFAAARVREAFEWRGYDFPRGRRVLLDLYGTNHDARVWDAPDTFRPERFANGPLDGFAFVPQGGGEFEIHHRCAGEWITIELMKTAVRFLSRAEYAVPEQDLAVSTREIPTLPRSRFVIEPGRTAGRAAGTGFA